MSDSHSLNTSTFAPPEHSFSSGFLSRRLSTHPVPAHASAVVLFLLPAASLLPWTVSGSSVPRDTSHSSGGSGFLFVLDTFHNLHFPSYRLLYFPHAVFSWIAASVLGWYSDVSKPLFLPARYAPAFCYPLSRQNILYLLFLYCKHSYKEYDYESDCLKSGFCNNSRILHSHLIVLFPCQICFSWCIWSEGTVLFQKLLLIQSARDDFPSLSTDFSVPVLLSQFRDLESLSFHRPYSLYKSYHLQSSVSYHSSTAILLMKLSYCLISVVCS